MFNVLGANLRHSHIWLSFGPVVEHVFISPAQHQIHHSSAVEHHDKNYGSLLAVWDWAFGTLYIPIAFQLNFESLIRCLSLWSNAKSDACCLNVKSKRFKSREELSFGLADGDGQLIAQPFETLGQALLKPCADCLRYFAPSRGKKNAPADTPPAE